MRGAAAVLVAGALLVGACTSERVATEPSGPTTTPTPSESIPASPPSPEIPPKPNVRFARLDGVYKIRLILIRSDLSFLPQKDSAKWRFDPKCHKGGGCDLKMHSISGKYNASVVFVGKAYRFAHRVPKGYTCGLGDNIDYYITVNRTYTFEPTKMRLVDDEWIATKIEGSELEQGTRGCGLSGPGITRYAIRGVLVD